LKLPARPRSKGAPAGFFTMRIEMDFKRRKHERAVAAEIANEIHRALGPAMPEVGENRDTVCRIFADAFDRHQVVSEASGERILKCVPKILAGLYQNYAELNSRLDAAVRQPLVIGIEK
jgi:hypothetical protein